MKSIGIFSLAFALTLPLSAHAEWSQGKPIKLVVPFPAGGGADIIARTLSEELSKNIVRKSSLKIAQVRAAAWALKWPLEKKPTAVL